MRKAITFSFALLCVIGFSAYTFHANSTTNSEEEQELIQGAQQVQVQGPPPGLAQVLSQVAQQGGQ